MILVDVDYWTTRYPAWPLLERLGDGSGCWCKVVHCVDDVAEAVHLLG